MKHFLRSGSLVAMCAAGFLFFGSVARAAQPLVSAPEYTRKAQVSVWQEGIGSRSTFSTFEDAYMQGGYLASGDVNGDGKDEIVIGSGPGRKNEVRIYTTDGKLIKSFQPFVWNYQGGVRVAVGAVDGDAKKEEIVVAPASGLEPVVMIFNDLGQKQREALVYGKDFRGGVRVAIGDLDRDGKSEIVTSSGPGGGPHVKLFNEKLENKGMDVFAFDASMQDGVSIAVIKTMWGDQLVVGTEHWSSPLIRRYSFDQQGGRLDKEFYVFGATSTSGVSVAAYDLDGDGVDEIAAWQNGETVPEVRVFDVYGTLYKKYLLHDPTYRGGLSLTSVQSDGDARSELASVSVAPLATSQTNAAKYIVVDISEQRLYAYERGREVKTFLISSGVTKHSTPIVDTQVSEKIPVKRYRWIYGAGNPDNYDLPNVKWNLRIYGPVYIHGAYWHNNFGHRMSHGCVNVHYTNAEWVYNWADVGTPVSIRE
ncbi:MAG: L,D-transpeptidase family protein [Candidatus Uhrbacteria bacterium]|nr:L,D-transpeptidase family protein [Candidatus Uhrbacteria bacterium]